MKNEELPDARETAGKRFLHSAFIIHHSS